jgi:hypothetical protein
VAALAAQGVAPGVVVDLVDGTYELFRQFHGLRRFTDWKKRPLAAAAGVLGGVLQLLENRATHVRRHRSRDRVVPQPAVARLQDR